MQEQKFAKSARYMPVDLLSPQTEIQFRYFRAEVVAEKYSVQQEAGESFPADGWLKRIGRKFSHNSGWTNGEKICVTE